MSNSKSGGVFKKVVFLGLLVSVFLYVLIIPGTITIPGQTTIFSIKADDLNGSFVDPDTLRQLLNQKTTNSSNITRIIEDHRKSVTIHPEHRKDLCYSCFKHNFKYILNNKHVCDVSKPDDRIELLIVITTIHAHFQNRQVLRNTWLSFSKNNTANIRYVFLFGKNDNQSLQAELKIESEIYGDIIQEDFKDAYTNLTYKTIMGYKWATKFCNRTKYVMKTDDDMWVNIPVLLEFLSGKNASIDTIYGACWSGAPHRNTKSKWYVSVNMYPHNKYPMFCSGTGYVLKLETAERLHIASEDLPFFYLEDVYTGLCLRSIGGKTENVKGFMVNGASRICLFKGNGIITSHHQTLNYIQEIWNTKC